MTGYVYMLTDPNGKRYIGETIDLKRRMRQYESALRSDDSDVYRAINLYGFENFKKEILETVEGEREFVQRRIQELEAHYIQKYDTVKNGYNVRSRDIKGGKPYVQSDEAREKIRKAQTGRKHSAESRMKRAGANAYQARGVKSETLGMRFDTLIDAARYVGISGGCKISECINGKRKSAGKHPVTNVPICDWEFV